MVEKKKYLFLFILGIFVMFLSAGCQLNYPTYPPGNNQEGYLKITTNPPGASIFLDYVYTGQTTPYTFTDIPAGSYLVSLVLSNYVDYYAIVRVQDNEEINLNIDLIPFPLVPPPK